MVRKKVSDRETKLLCLQSGGICAFPNCGKLLIAEGTESDEPVITGEIAHIVAYEPGGPRGDPSFPEEELNKHTNLILLCGDHHKLIDSQCNTFSVPVLREMKKAHEQRMREPNQPHVVAQPEKLIQDSLHSSLLEVSHLPAFVFSAPTLYDDHQMGEVKERLQYPKNEWELAPFVLKEGRIYTFHDLRRVNNPFQSVLSSSDVKKETAQKLWSSAEGKRRYQTLLNRSLYKYTARLNIRYDPEHRRFYFPAHKDGGERSVPYRPLNQSQSTRLVAWAPKRKSTGEAKNFWIHLAAALKFHEVAPLQWCLSIRPERRLTSDGKIPLASRQIGRRVTRLKAKMHNDLYLKEVQFWRDYLSKSKPQIILNFGDQSAIINASQLVSFDIEWPGIPDDIQPFKNQVYEQDLFSYSELLQATEGDESDFGEEYDFEEDE